jgi:hypothetical protein
MIRMAASSAHPPVEWITVEPARSYMESSRKVPSSILAPHDQLTISG